MSGKRKVTRGRRRAGVAAAAALVLTGASWGGVQMFSTQAEALTPPVAITADELPTWQTNGIVWAAAESNGTVFVGGTFSAIRPPGSAAGSNETQALNFAAFDAATGAPTDCKLNFTIGSGTARVTALDVSPDGRTLYAGGYFSGVNGQGAASLVAIDIASCTMKTSFRAAMSSTVRAIDATEDAVYVGGDFKTVNGATRNRFAAVNASSGATLAWNPNTELPGRAVDVLPGGDQVAIGGDFFTVGGKDSHALAVVSASSGAVSKAYPGFIEKRSVVKSLTSDDTGFYTGNEGTGGGAFDGRIALDTDDLGQRWRDTCLGATQSVIVWKSVLYSGSHAHNCSDTPNGFPDGPRRHLLAQKTGDPTLLGWAPNTNDGLPEAIGPRALVVSTKDDTDYLWVGGTFTTVNSKSQQGLTRFASGPDTGKPWTTTANTPTVSGGDVRLTWRASQDTDDSDLTYKIYRNGNYTTPVASVKGASVPWNRPTFGWTDTDVDPGETYSYRVTATDGAGNTSGLSATVSVTVPAGKASTKKGLTGNVKPSGKAVTPSSEAVKKALREAEEKAAERQAAQKPAGTDADGATGTDDGTDDGTDGATGTDGTVAEGAEQ